MTTDSLIVHITDETFDDTTKNGIVLLDFYADWCGPCRMLTPVLEEIAEDLQGKVTIAKLDIDTQTKTASKFEVSSVPTMIIFNGGKEVERIIGLRDAETLKEILAKLQ